jgi:hypothetical protein
MKRMEEKVNVGFWLENLIETQHLGDMCVDERIILKCVLNGNGLD